MRRRHRRAVAPRRGGSDRLRGDQDHGRLAAFGPVSSEVGTGPRLDSHPLQHRSARVRSVRHRAGRRPGGPSRGPRAPCVGRRDPAVSAGLAPDHLGAGAGRRAAYAIADVAAATSWRRGEVDAVLVAQRPCRRERRYGEQSRHVPAGGAGGPPRRPVLRLRTSSAPSIWRRRRARHPDRGARRDRGAAGPRTRIAPLETAVVQPGIRRHPGGTSIDRHRDRRGRDARRSTLRWRRRRGCPRAVGTRAGFAELAAMARGAAPVEPVTVATEPPSEAPAAGAGARGRDCRQGVVWSRSPSGPARPSGDRAPHDRPGRLRSFLGQDRLYAAYDDRAYLEEREFPRTRWASPRRRRAVAVGLEYAGPTPQPLFVMG